MRNVIQGLLGMFIFTLMFSCSQIQKPESQEAFTVTIPQRVYWNSNITVSVQASPGTACNLKYITPAGNLSDADGLGQTIANANRICSWSWKVDKTKEKGSGRLIFTVNGVSETHFIEVWSTE